MYMFPCKGMFHDPVIIMQCCCVRTPVSFDVDLHDLYPYTGKYKTKYMY